MVKAIVFALGIAAVAGSCALFSEGPPENFCRADTDCFRAQGEVCDLETQTCIPGNGVPADASDAPLDTGDAIDAPDDAIDAPPDT